VLREVSFGVSIQNAPVETSLLNLSRFPIPQLGKSHRLGAQQLPDQVYIQ